ncbi:isoprenyl transferase [Mammaliicoccus stepanovicii]|uniref:Isoprenyl transferase n=1 Tax=Mammaliicoccus stepanovicii TaxID=643214 RepID=A0A239ZGQ8_9STAP|nr:isoprenyl transferase [Mammaliicoccus stepanovicii]PNZ78004.1 isoprenyl transferase [Mammaliicoccus stepanovicii]GGI41801.1 isoprenyl transferase [Mammaliicoccus stepanovicii]SNV70422.1 Undecaprenyl pyrophosphate synthetase [Mammaliicoccus stepanovicii]
MIKKFKKQKQQINTQETELTIPNHIAIIMDGNGRWAKNKKMPRIKGHYEGMQTVKKITRKANDLGVKYLTLYAFSTENWSRPEDEVKYLMKLPVDFLKTFLPELIEKNVKVTTIGFTDQLPKHTKNAINEAIEKTKHNTGLNLVFALNYGGRAEIVHAVKALYKEVEQGKLSVDQITEENIEKSLFTSNMPDPELLIRTSGEERLSNFLIWQSSYSEFVFTKTLWPDFDEQSLIDCLKIYQSRQRRFGGL